MNPYDTLTAEQAAILHRIKEAGASHPSTAKSLVELRIEDGADLQELLARGIVQRDDGAPDTYYATLSRYAFMPALLPWARGSGGLVRTAVIVAVILIIVALSHLL